jgi:hypothetical protein
MRMVFDKLGFKEVYFGAGSFPWSQTAGEYTEAAHENAQRHRQLSR